MNKLIELLESAGITKKTNLELYHYGTRDNPNVNVLKCKETGIYVLDRIAVNDNYYKHNTMYPKRGKVLIGDNREIATKMIPDNIRRFDQHFDFFNEKTVCDFGCGKGDFLREINHKTNKAVGVELNQINKKTLQDVGFQVKDDILEFELSFDTVFLNHVFEHLTNPIEVLDKIKNKMKDDGDLIIEVPHSKDFLLETINLDSFKKFTFWSEHIILHNEESLSKILEYSGYKLVKIDYVQRYPISNHFYWLMNGSPGGHEKFTIINDNELITSYSNFLKKIQQTDTLLGYFKKA